MQKCAINKVRMMIIQYFDRFLILEETDIRLMQGTMIKLKVIVLWKKVEKNGSEQT